MESSSGPELALVSEEDPRAGDVRARRDRLFSSLSKAAAEAKKRGFDIDRGSFSKAEKGTASDYMYRRVGAFFDAVEEEGGTDDGENGEGHLVTFTISGNFGVTATVSGPVGDFDELKNAAKELMREAMREGRDTPE